MHTSHLPDIVTNLQNVLGSHIVQRNVLLSSSVDSNYHSNAYTWTTAYATLMSIGQITGTFAANRNKYDDGEANYKLPLFNYENYWNDSGLWLRGVASSGHGASGVKATAATIMPGMSTVTAAPAKPVSATRMASARLSI